MKTPQTIEARWYTYLLIDPANGEVFYVGKGHGKRMSEHVRQVKAGKSTGNPRKDHKIREILLRGEQVTEQIFSRHGEEEDALDAEDLLIEALAGPDLANIVGSRAMERKERMELLLARVKPFDVWVRTCDPSCLEFASRFAGSAFAFYEKFVAEVKKESRRIGGNTYYAHC